MTGQVLRAQSYGHLLVTRLSLNVTGHSQYSSYCRATAPLACDFNNPPPHPTPGIHSWFLPGEPGATPRGERPMGNAGLRDRW